MKQFIFAILMMLVAFVLCIAGFVIYQEINKKNTHNITNIDITQKSKTLSSTLFGGGRDMQSEITIDANDTLSTEDKWVESFSNSDKKSYMYPALELNVKFDLLKNQRNQNAINISMSNLDEYKFFCLNQVLKQKDIQSTYYKSGKLLRLLIFLDDEKKIKQLLEDLAYYKIEYQLN